MAGFAGDTPATTPTPTPVARAGSLFLTRRQLWLRLTTLVALGLAAVALRVVNPEAVSWLPWRTSCGAVTGLPCLFCGMTRALHHLFAGDFSEAVYFNWLAFPVSGLALGMAIIFGAELALRRRVTMVATSFRFTPRMAAIGGIAVVLLWVLQVSLAISQGKSELLNSFGPLYSLFLDN